MPIDVFASVADVDRASKTPFYLPPLIQAPPSDEESTDGGHGAADEAPTDGGVVSHPIEVKHPSKDPRSPGTTAHAPEVHDATASLAQGDLETSDGHAVAVGAGPAAPSESSGHEEVGELAEEPYEFWRKGERKRHGIPGMMRCYMVRDWSGTWRGVLEWAGCSVG